MVNVQLAGAYINGTIFSVFAVGRNIYLSELELIAFRNLVTWKFGFVVTFFIAALISSNTLAVTGPLMAFASQILSWTYFHVLKRKYVTRS